ncbi:MAG: bifunctional folylpolyglutamate synthase/dihydrofolate synthase [Eubacterium sp.]|nr:bifunctional folylpolyglutamate synthase/dihydrofolate synthase [Eubacterium sp.]
MNFRESMEYLDSVPKFSPKDVVSGAVAYELGAMRTLMESLGNPEKQLRFVHIAGTNGKGSASAFLSQILIESGLRTGSFNSPAIEHFTEQFRINGHDITEEAFAAILTRVASQIQQNLRGGKPQPTQFEILVAVMFLYFHEQNCDIVVLETGMGGLLDATNVIPSPEAAVIMTISMDHTEILGRTLREIAFQKAGIIKEDTDVLLYPQKPEADQVFEAVCREKKARLHRVNVCREAREYSLQGQIFDLTLEADPQISLSEMSLPESSGSETSVPETSVLGTSVPETSVSEISTDNTSASGTTIRDLFIPLLGSYQCANASMAVAAAKILRQKGYPITEDAVRKGLKHTVWHGRFELMRKNPAVIVDGGHNPEGAAMLRDSLIRYFPGQKITFLMGILADKDYHRVIDIVGPLAKHFYTVPVPNPRALDPEQLARELREAGYTAEACGSIEEATDKALKNSTEKDVICSFGSLYYVGRIREHLKTGFTATE